MWLGTPGSWAALLRRFAKAAVGLPSKTRLVLAAARGEVASRSDPDSDGEWLCRIQDRGVHRE